MTSRITSTLGDLCLILAIGCNGCALPSAGVSEGITHPKADWATLHGLRPDPDFPLNFAITHIDGVKWEYGRRVKKRGRFDCFEKCRLHPGRHSLDFDYLAGMPFPKDLSISEAAALPFVVALQCGMAIATLSPAVRGACTLDYSQLCEGPVEFVVQAGLDYELTLVVPNVSLSYYAPEAVQIIEAEFGKVVGNANCVR